MCSSPLLAVLIIAALARGDDHATGTGITRDEALSLAFPRCRIESESAGLTDEEVARVRELAGTEPERRLVRAHRGVDEEGEIVGTAYVDVHRVRTLRESLLVVVDPEGRVARIELLAFAEPPEYAPRAKWYAQLVGKELDDHLSLRGSVRGIAGATLTSRAIVDSVRRILAVHAVLAARETPGPEPEGTPPEKSPPEDGVPPKNGDPPKVVPPEDGGPEQERAPAR